MKKRIIMFLAVTMAAVGVRADTWTDPDTGYTWTYRVNGDEAELYGESSWPYTKCLSPSPTGAVVIPSTLGSKPVTSIGQYAFYGCSGLSSITIPNSVTSIGEHAFSFCEALTSVTMPDGITSIGDRAFNHCRDLARVTIPNSVTNIGNGAFFYCTGLTDVTIPDSVTSIGDYAFENCSGLTSVIIPGSVTSIGYAAFSDCSSLATVTIANNVNAGTSIGGYAFYGCSSLINVTIPKSVTSISGYAFSETPFYDSQSDGLVVFGSVAYKMKGTCPSSVVIPDGIASIGDRAFYCCDGLKSVTIPDSVTSIGDYAFGSCFELLILSIPKNITNIGNGAFSACRKMVGSITIPNGVTSIGDNTFDWCGIGSVTIPDSVTSIGNSAFDHCWHLKSVTISDSVTNIGYEAFHDCGEWNETIINIADMESWSTNAINKLLRGKRHLFIDGIEISEFEIPDGVTSIGEDAFAGCSSLASVTIPNSVTNIGSSAFSGCSGLTAVYISDLAKWCGVSFGGSDANPLYYAKNLFLNGLLVETLIIPNTVTSIEQYAFYNCSGLTSATIPDTVTSIGDDAFSGCSGLTSFTIPDGVTSIGSYVFCGCSGLMRVTIPDSVTSIGDSAFYVCSGLTSVTIPDLVTRLGYDAFAGCSSLTSVIFKGNAPAIGGCAFRGLNENCVAYVPANSTGYGDADTWQGMKVVRYQSLDEFSFVVTFNANGGSVTPVSKSVENGKAVGELPTPIRSGYTFAGWYTAAGGGTQISASTKIVDNVTYYAHWVADEATEKCTVTFDVNGSGALRDEEVTRTVVKGAAVGELPTPAVPSCVDSGFGDFLGWFTAKTGGTQISAATIVTKDVTYYAHWKYFRYIALDANGGEFSSDYDDWWPFVENGATLGSLPAVSRSGYTFDGWYTAASGGTRVSADTKITATVSNVKEPLKYYAHWTADVSFPDVTTWKFYEEADDDEGLNLAAWEDRSVADVAFWIGAGINMAIPVEGNFTVDDVVLVAGTYSDYGRPQVVSDEWMFAKHYTALKAAIGYDPYEDDEYDEGAYGLVFEDDVKGRNFSLSMDIWPQKKVVSSRKWILLEMGGRPTKGCKTFYLGLKGRDDAGYSRFRIYATPDQGVSQRPSDWSGQRELAVLPMPIGGGTTSGSGMYAKGTRVSLSAKSNAGYEFDGWYDQSSGQLLGTSTSLDYVTTGANKTIFAKFGENTGLVVTFNANGGVVEENSRIVAKNNAVGTLPVPTRTGFTFAGWWTAASGGTQVTEATRVSSSVTYYAHWTQGGGSVVPGYEVIEEKDITVPYEAPKAVTLQGVASDGGKVVGIVELKLGKVNAKKKASKVSGSVTTLDGKKHAIKAVTLTEIDGTAPKAVELEVKDFGTMSVTIGGTQFAGSLGGYHVQSAVVGGNWTRADARVYVDGALGERALPEGTVAELLPDGEPVVVSGGKWKFAKAAGVKWAKPKADAARSKFYNEASGKDLIVDDTKGKTNLSGLKLTYTPKKGTFKGSFKVYALVGEGKATKLKKYTFKVSGVVVGGVGYGTATCKTPAVSWAVTVK